MLYIFLTFLSGIFSGMISIYFRNIELKKKVILMPKQLILQIFLFAAFFWIFGIYFSSTQIVLPFMTLSWSWIYIIFSTFSYYMVQVFFEYFSGKTLFATEKEMQDYIEKLEEENKF